MEVTDGFLRLDAKLLFLQQPKIGPLVRGGVVLFYARGAKLVFVSWYTLLYVFNRRSSHN